MATTREAVVEVLAEAAVAAPSRGEVAVRRGDARARRRGACAWPPTRSNLALLEDAEELRLQPGGSSPISSRKSVPPSAASKRPAVRRGGAGEGALLVAEELALEQALGDRGAVDRDERPRRAARLRSWMARATSSLPVPVSPRMSTVASVGATLPMRAKTSSIGGDEPTMPLTGQALADVRRAAP